MEKNQENMVPQNLRAETAQERRMAPSNAEKKKKNIDTEPNNPLTYILF